MYLLFRFESPTQMQHLERIGDFLGYVICKAYEGAEDAINLEQLKAVKLTEAEATAYPFLFIGWRGYVNVRQDSSLGTWGGKDIFSSLEPDSTEKVRYDLTDDDVANTVSLTKKVMRAILNRHYDTKFKELNLVTDELETATWEEQKREADAYFANSSASVPMLTKLAAARGITVAALVTKIRAAVDNYNDSLGTLLATKQGIEAEIKACTTISACNVILHQRFNCGMPEPQKAIEEITTNPRFNLS